MKSVRIEHKRNARLMELIERENCVYCGHVDDTLIITNDGKICCKTCRQSKGNLECSEWLRSLKVTDPVLWIKVVDNHRLNSTPIANLVRKIRIE